MDTHQLVVSLLEHFEIMYRMRMRGSGPITEESELNDEQIFFVPSLLLCLSPTEVDHPSFRYWRQIEPKYMKCQDHEKYKY